MCVLALGDAGARGQPRQQAPDIAVIHWLAERVLQDSAEERLATRSRTAGGRPATARNAIAVAVALIPTVRAFASLPRVTCRGVAKRMLESVNSYAKSAAAPKLG